MPADMDGYTLLMCDDFDEKQLNTDYWLPTYLPQWSSRKNTIPSYTIQNSILSLYIADTQEPWCPEWNGSVRVSNLQTGVFSGEIGSSVGQHHFTEGLIVREFQPRELKITPLYGYIECRVRCHISKENVAALWMIGVEETPEQSSEICLFELKGWQAAEKSAVIGYGIHSFGDPNLVDEFYEHHFDICVSDWNVYSVKWEEQQIAFYLNGEKIRVIHQSPNYPMQLMLNLYDLKNIKNERNRIEADYVNVYQQDIYRRHQSCTEF